ncbi:hypothetical protein BZA05DRAFT_476299 [Tricharina praecox]|uniref:uncharacterized protein n=1 Tax=Tricharina praecox TaxID=43433 RepID=UPI0022211F1C|nr:uncharacterized protein BZA05DRAFT_476299 [Tricharina praecox]KAI5846204.1 hypothetical protein BZA05DRAFT_476299 [Tricharina praecox]
MPPRKMTGSAPTATPRRQSARTKAPVKKSPYFEHPSEDEDEGHKEESDTASDFEAESEPDDAVHEDEVEASEGREEEADEDEEEEKAAKPARKRTLSTAAISQPRVVKKKKASTGEVFIPHQRAPSPGDIEYADDQIHPNTLRFLSDLTENNNRSWLHGHDAVYRAGKADFDKFVDSMTAAMPERVDDTIPELPVKDLVFRIHRDIRFSNDQTPYKTYFSAAWSRTGRKGPYACYYLQIKPGETIAAGGLWHPEAQALGLIRRSIDKHPERLKRVLTGEGFATEFFGKSKRNEKNMVKSFVAANAAYALKTAPKNYPKDHKDIALLRLKSFTVSKTLDDKDVLSPEFLNRVLDMFKNMEPLITYLNRVIKPDAGDNDDDDSDDDEDADGEDDEEDAEGEDDDAVEE